MEYFSQVKTVQGATKRYRALAKKWHTDRNGSVEAGAVMAEINRQYKEALVRISAVEHTADKQELNTQSASYQKFSDSSANTRDRVYKRNRPIHLSPP